jgi:hypothetical protein
VWLVSFFYRGQKFLLFLETLRSHIEYVFVRAEYCFGSFHIQKCVIWIERAYAPRIKSEFLILNLSYFLPQLLLSSWKRSFVPGICGLIAGSLYRLNVLGIRRMKVIRALFSFYTSIIQCRLVTSFYMQWTVIENWPLSFLLSFLLGWFFLSSCLACLAGMICHIVLALW